MGTLLGPKYIPYTYMDPLGQRKLRRDIFQKGNDGAYSWSLEFRVYVFGV